MTLTAKDRADRESHWDYVEQSSSVRRATLLRLGDDWDGWNARWFGGVLVRPVILLAPPSSTARLGETASIGGYGEPSEIRIRPSLLAGTHPRVHGDPEGCYRYGADVLLHETIHLWGFDVTGQAETSYHGHGPSFTGKCNEIGAELGLAPVVVRNRRGSHLPRSAQWPHNVRDPAYYLGAYDPEGVPAGGDEPDDPPGGEDECRCPACGRPVPR